jgi:cyclophilin family peptidyl-prolyl cis-trans isomerase
MRPRIPLAAAAFGLLAAVCAPACASSGPHGAPGQEGLSPRLHHLLDLEDARAPLPELEPFLGDPDPQVRARAALAAGRKGGPGAAGLLRIAALDPEAPVRTAAVFAMGISADPELAGDALLAVRRAGATTDEAAAAAASAVGLAGERAWREEPFAALLAHPVPEVRRAAFRALVGAVRGWKEKPRLDSPFAAAVVGAMKADPATAGCAAVVLRSLAPPAEPDGAAPSPPAGGGDGLWDLRTTLALTRSVESSDDPDVRGACLQALGALGLGDSKTLGGLLGKEPAARARVGLVRGLAKRKDADSVEVLGGALRGDADFSVRAAAADALAVRGENARAAVPALAEAASGDGSRLVRVSAVQAMDAVGGDEARAAVAAAARSPDPYLRAAAAGKLLPVADLALLVRDPEVRVRESAADAAGKRGREGLAVCLDALRDADPVVAATAASGLGEMKADEARQPLEEVLEAHPAPQAAPDDTADLRGAALEALGKLKAPRARELAAARLGDPDPSVRDAAAGVLEAVDGKRPDLPLAPRLLPFPDRPELRVSDEGAPRVRIETDRGTFVVQSLPSAAPVATARFLARVRAGGYDGTVFHRIVPAFVVQGGDPRGDGSGSGGATVREEFSLEPFDRGALGVPRGGHPDSGGCQLFFCHGATPHLDRRYTVTGRIVEGIEVIDRIDLGDRILRATVEGL